MSISSLVGGKGWLVGLLALAVVLVVSGLGGAANLWQFDGVETPSTASFSISTQTSNPRGTFLNESGDVMIVADAANDELEKYTLGTPDDLSTASHTQTASLTNTATPYGVWVHPSGTELWVVSGSQNDIDSYTMSSPWDLSTLSYNSTHVFTDDRSGLAFGDNGTVIFTGDFSSGMKQHDLGTAYDISTIGPVAATYTQTGVYGIDVAPNGRDFFLAGQSTDDPTHVQSGTAWNISTSVLVDQIDVSGSDTTITGIHLQDDGQAVFLNGNQNDDIFEFNLTAPYAFWSYEWNQGKVKDISGQSGNPWNFEVSNNGTKLYSVDPFNTAVYEYNLNTPYEVSSAAFVQAASFAYAVEDFWLADNGTYALTTDDDNDRVVRYSLSSAFDVSTLSQVDVLDVSGQTMKPIGLDLNSTGDTLIVLHRSAPSKVISYSLSSPFDLSSGSHDSTYTIGFDAVRRGLAVNETGTGLFMTDSDNGQVHEFSMGTAWDVSTLNPEGNLSTGQIQGSSMSGVEFAGGGEVFYTGSFQDDIYQFNFTGGAAAGAAPLTGDVVAADAQTTAPCFVYDVDTNYESTGWSVYARDIVPFNEDCSSTDRSSSTVWKLDKNLNTANRGDVCAGSSLANAKQSQGLDVEFGGRIVYICRATRGDSGTSKEVVMLNGPQGADEPLGTGVEDSITLGGSTGGVEAEWDPADTFNVSIEARSLNRIASFGDDEGSEVAGHNSLHIGQYDFGAESVVQDTSTSAWDVSQSEGDEKWVAYTGPSGTAVYYNVDGGLVASALGEGYDFVQIHDERLWTAEEEKENGDGGIKAYEITEGGSISEIASSTFKPDAGVGIVSSKDGRYLLAVNSTNVTLFNGTTLDPLATTDSSVLSGNEAMNFADMDVNNNYIYAGSILGKIWRFPVYNYTVSFNGTAGMNGTENPTPLEGFTEDKEGSTGVDEPSGETAGFAGLSVSNIVDAFGISETAAGWFLGVLLMLGLGAGFWGLTKSGAGAMVGAIGGIGLSMAFGWLPTWFVVLAFAAFMAVVLVRVGGD